MLNLRPLFYVIGWLICALGAAMLFPVAADLIHGDGDHGAFLVSAALAVLIGLGMIFACHADRRPGLSVQQTFLLTTLTWIALPLVGALPFWFSTINVSFIDAFFEAMSGITTTGSTVFSGLDFMPHGVLLWRALLQWFGGVGIIVMAVAILPELQVGGMQLFRSESFDTMGKLLPRAREIANAISGVYIGLTFACMMTYAAMGVKPFDALCHAMTTIATGGFANSDFSFMKAQPMVEYAAAFYMLLASLPFIRYVQLVNGQGGPLLRDSQVRAFMSIAAAVILALSFAQAAHAGWSETAFRKALFNGVSILSGTGYASADYWLWGGFAAVMFFLIGLVGGCAGSTCCAIKVFRLQVLFAVAKAEVGRVFSPRRAQAPRYEGRRIDESVVSSVMAFFLLFCAAVAALSIALGLMGEDFVTAVSGAATAVANVGPGLGDKIGPAGNFAKLADEAKALLCFGMLLGRLELFSVLILFTPAFWRV